ncbi:DNA-binding transcription factor YAP1 [Nakaseomyces bracarensis]|uniref:DNA-binding transcription factor YAP1 n=1 Tax=Nakaseomyces bracarensis TaxID=273131 RepID=UPI0038725420
MEYSVDTGRRASANSNERKRKTYQDLDPETRMKRIAQNRAAQKAFRERKERKMRELEKKVVDLESLTKLNEVETDFLRDQLSVLVKELKKYRPETKQDAKVLRYLEKYNSMQKQAQVVSNSTSSSSSGHHLHNHHQQQQQQHRSPSTALATGNRISKDSSVLPGATIIRQDLESFSEKNRHFNNATGQLTPPRNGGASTTKSNSVSDTTSVSGPSMDDGVKLEHTNTEEDWLDGVMKGHEQMATGQPSAGVDFNNYFDEQVSEFCGKLNQACGTKQCPIPQSKSKANTPIAGTSMTSLSSTGSPSMFQNNDNNNVNVNSNLTTDPAFLSNTWGDDLSPGSNKNSNIPTVEFDSNNSAINTDALAATDAASGFGQLGFGDSFLGNDILFSPNSPTYSPSVLGSGRTQEVYRSAAVQNKVIEEHKNKTTDLPFINSSLAFPSDHDNTFFRDTNAFDLDDNDGDDNFRGNDDLMNDIFGDNVSSDNNDLTLNGLVKEDLATPKSDKPSVTGSLKPEGSDGLFRHSSFRPCQTVPDLSVDSDDEENDDSVVPSRDDGLLRCSEIWDRITAHPKYSDIDIDGLCSELMAKAKCSERGVVINADDVQVALNKHLA